MKDPKSVQDLLKALAETKRREPDLKKRARQDAAWAVLRARSTVLRNSDVFSFAELGYLNGAVTHGLRVLADATPIEPTSPPSGVTEQDAERMAA